MPAPSQAAHTFIKTQQAARSRWIQTEHVAGAQADKIGHSDKRLLGGNLMKPGKLLAHTDGDTGRFPQAPEGVTALTPTKHALRILEVIRLHAFEHAYTVGDRPGSIAVYAHSQIVAELPSDFPEQLHVPFVIAADLELHCPDTFFERVAYGFDALIDRPIPKKKE
jgi:hypothetical protein